MVRGIAQTATMLTKMDASHTKATSALEAQLAAMKERCEGLESTNQKLESALAEDTTTRKRKRIIGNNQLGFPEIEVNIILETAWPKEIPLVDDQAPKKRKHAAAGASGASSFHPTAFCWTPTAFYAVLDPALHLPSDAHTLWGER